MTRKLAPPALLALGLASSALASPPHPIPSTSADFHLDGKLDEAAWRDAWSAELPFEVQPAENIDAVVRTEVLVIHDDDNLYVGMRAYDPDPGAIRAHYSDRDNAWDDDWMGVVLDTFNDERRNYLLVVNPLGVQIDRIEVWSGESGDGTWDGLWDSAARITEWGWAAEMRIPFTTLRFQRSAGAQIWGFDAIRGYPRDHFRQMGAFARDRDNNCYLCQAIKLEGFREIKPGRNLEIIPTATASRIENRPNFPDGDFEVDEEDVDAGLTVRWGITPNLSLAGTLNPDFSQVEADALQLDVNEAFALFYPEKRPFFMEGADYFSTPITASYTRVMRDPQWGVKLTGKERGHTIAGYVVRDDLTHVLLPGSTGSADTALGVENTSSVLRYRREVGRALTVGALGTHREASGVDYRNSLGGVDLNLRLGQGNRFLLQVLGSSTEDPTDVAAGRGRDATDQNGSAAEFIYTRTGRTVGGWSYLTNYDRDFRADLGYVPRVDVRGGEVGFYVRRAGQEGNWYNNLDLRGKYELKEQHDGSLLFTESVLQGTVQAAMQSRFVLRLNSGSRGYGGQEFGAAGVTVVAQAKPSGRSSIGVTARYSQEVDYSNVQEGDRLRVTSSGWYRLGRHLRLEGALNFESMDVDAGRLYEATVAELTTAWQFNARSFLRLILQGVRYDFRTALYSDGRGERSEALYSQLLYSYKLNPQTVLFLGYSDSSYGEDDFALKRYDRAVFAKIGYSWLL